MTIPILLSKLKKCSKSRSGKSGVTPYSPDLAPNLEQGSLQTIMLEQLPSRACPLSQLNGQACDSYQNGLNKLVLRSDKSLNRFGDYVEK
ncbi:hypothetical protein AVEN_267975-1 [Araneus ventricosus]|uniref:Uncharacterized protein n=1 Tax=Araneus ventricosus TaxID=182803 RepID=A0A4Y2IZD3_ARAVE|nr:hypothetical protein AVEN_267975-1 [Araneus ventricosus]